MDPTLKDGEVVYINHRVPSAIPRGTIVLISDLDDSLVVKRVVGLPQERVFFRFGEVFINGQMLFEPYLPYEQTTFDWKHADFRLPPDEYLVLGDNRLTSQDSREYGPIPKSRIVGILDVRTPVPRLLHRPNFRVLKSSPNREAILRNFLASQAS